MPKVKFSDTVDVKEVPNKKRKVYDDTYSYEDDHANEDDREGSQIKEGKGGGKDKKVEYDSDGEEVDGGGRDDRVHEGEEKYDATLSLAGEEGEIEPFNLNEERYGGGGHFDSNGNYVFRRGGGRRTRGLRLLRRRRVKRVQS